MRFRTCSPHRPLLAACASSPAHKNRSAALWKSRFIDTEGGAATLIVTPAGESILIDCGNPGSRDAERIHEAATDRPASTPSTTSIITHWHSDHYGGAAASRKLMPIRNFYDRGIPDDARRGPATSPLLIARLQDGAERQVEDAEGRRRDHAEAGRRRAGGEAAVRLRAAAR